MVFLTEAAVVAPGVARLAWTDGAVREVDLRPWMTRHPLLEALSVPEIFRDVEIVHGGSGLGWPNGADFCAQALRELADQQLAAREQESAE